MSEDKDSKTEEPTSKKLRDAREKGQVAKSKEVVSATGILLIIGTVWGMSSHIVERLLYTFAVVLEAIRLPFGQALPKAMQALMDAVFFLSVPFLVLGIISVLVGSLSQFGFLMTTETIKPDIKKIDPVTGFKNLFKAKKMLELLQATIKIGVLFTVSVLIIRGALQDILLIPYCGLPCALPVFDHVIRMLLLALIPLLVVIAAWDFMFQKKEYTKEQRMTKDEVKREYKQTQGDPIIKGARRQIQRETAGGGSMQSEIKRSTCVVTGAGLAIAIRYVPGDTPVPQITVSEKENLAIKVIVTARSKRIPVINDPALAGLIKQKNLGAGDWIPSSMFNDIARVLVEVRKLQGG
ncbi:MAG: EscU/YscU/HrcU family type III secretion system export apparatus switch protein [Aquisalimonadaceae bacterium]